MNFSIIVQCIVHILGEFYMQFYTHNGKRCNQQPCDIDAKTYFIAGTRKLSSVSPLAVCSTSCWSLFTNPTDGH